ncbi:hypothetical protein [Desulfovirgula thermocuniculi]|uniref:spermine/spermidine synthase domain-containing protein n=1 Tax=Desulfovirgula thermocuniculi TaxID=348842 RepID=UPI000420B363|nr:hypothetical protein [Desulfovirgula thermocuniculi]
MAVGSAAETATVRWLREEEDYGMRFYRVRRVIACRRTPYQKAEVLEVCGLGRCLFLDGRLQSAEADEHVYHELLVHPAVAAHPAPRRILVCGAGECATVREILKHPPVERVVAVDIDREAVELCLAHLGFDRGGASDPRCELVFTDAAEFVASYRGGPFDVAVVDVTDDPGGPAWTVYTERFYRSLKRVLSEDYAVAVQGTSALPGARGSAFASLYRVLRDVFDRVVPYAEYIPSFEDLWGFFLCTGGRAEAVPPPGRLPRGLRYLDGGALTRAFSLPGAVRRALKGEGTQMPAVAFGDTKGEGRS